MPTRTVGLAAAWLLLGVPLGAQQRIPRSQRGSVMQMIGETLVTVTYSRPVARGRTIFGDVVRWDRVWMPGADSATILATSGPLLIEGQRLEAGEYSVWAIPGEQQWAVILSRAAHVWHTNYPGEAQDALRLTLTPKRAEHLETVTFHFPLADGPRAVLAFHWEQTAVELKLELPGPP
jgi:hypothetical protein